MATSPAAAPLCFQEFTREMENEHWIVTALVTRNRVIPPLSPPLLLLNFLIILFRKNAMFALLLLVLVVQIVLLWYTFSTYE